MSVVMPFLAPYPPLLDEVVRRYRHGGIRRGHSTGWDVVDQLFTVAPAQVTIVTGTPGAGKSEWLDALMVNLAEQHDWAFAVYSPENHPVSIHVIKLLEKRLRKPFSEGPSERMSEREAKDGFFWVGRRFMWLEPEFKSPDALIETALSYQPEQRPFGIVLDPWNTLEHQRGGMSETDYTSFILTSVQQAARSSGAHVFLVVHPQKIQRNRDGTRPVPTPYDLSGSAHWYNKADNIVCIHRDQTDHTNQSVDVHVQKVRFKHIGHAGLATLAYDNVTGRYFELPVGVPGERYADPQRGATPPEMDFERLAIQSEGQ